MAARIKIHAIVDEGLGNSSYLVDIGDGRALALDPSRDPRQYMQLAGQHGLRIAYAAETHLHADFVSGSRELAAQGATILASAAGRREFPHTALHDGDETDLGGLTLRALTTAGHTHEHLVYLLLDGSWLEALFSGGSLMVGSVARTDLVDPSRTDVLARAAYRSLHERILNLPDDLAVYPTHGAGSFCAAPAVAERTTTIGRERASNPLLAVASEDEFVSALLSGLGTYPTYFHRLAEVNRRGPRVLGGRFPLDQLGPADVRRLMAEGAIAVDVRAVPDFAASHIPGALSIALRPAFGTWLGWLVTPEQPIVFVAGEGQDRDDLVRQTLNVGYENIAGELAGGMNAWSAAGYSVRHIHLTTPGSIGSGAMLDVRQENEFDAGHIPGALHVELGALPSASDVPSGPVTLMCRHGERAMSGASVLERAGHTDLSVLVGGAAEWAELPGHKLALSS